MAELLSPEEREIWDQFPANRKQISKDGIHILLVEYEPFSELVRLTPKRYIELFGQGKAKS